MTDLPTILQAVNVLIVPALVYVVRIDRRMGQLDTLQTVNAAKIDKLETRADDINQRLTRLEFKP
jgi:hypothetical protein